MHVIFQVTTLNNSLASIDQIKKETAKQCNYIHEKLLHLQNVQRDLNLLKETFVKDNTHFRQVHMDFAKNLEEIRSTFNQQNVSFENMWREQTGIVQNVIQDVQGAKQAIDEQKAKYTGKIIIIKYTGCSVVELPYRKR